MQRAPAAGRGLRGWGGGARCHMAPWGCMVRSRAARRAGQMATATVWQPRGGAQVMGGAGSLGGSAVRIPWFHGTMDVFRRYADRQEGLSCSGRRGGSGSGLPPHGGDSRPPATLYVIPQPTALHAAAGTCQSVPLTPSAMLQTSQKCSTPGSQFAGGACPLNLPACVVWGPFSHTYTMGKSPAGPRACQPSVPLQPRGIIAEIGGRPPGRRRSTRSHPYFFFRIAVKVRAHELRPKAKGELLGQVRIGPGWRHAAVAG